MGTPEFACKPLLALHESRHEVLAVVTGRDKRRGRRGMPCSTDVCCSAKDLGLPVLTPKSLKSEKLYKELTAFNADLFVVIAFRILPERLFCLPKWGAINIHASLLPKYRGAAPINWALINGEEETGLTSFVLRRKVDAGDIILQEKVTIGENENYDSLYDRMSEKSGAFLLKSIELLEKGDFTPILQDESLVTPAPKIQPFDALIDFGLPAPKVRDFVRGLSTKPGAYTLFRGKQIKIITCRVAETGSSATVRPGTIIIERKRLLIQCAESVIEILTLIPEGKKLMDGISFLSGARPKPGELFGEALQKIKE